MSTVPDQATRDLVARTGLERTLFVEAGAGTGKTTLLVDRLLAPVRSIVIPGFVSFVLLLFERGADS